MASLAERTMRLGLLLLLLAAAAAGAQVPRTENTYSLGEGASPPPATLEDVGWLVGSWEATGLGGTLEEVWNPPSAGSMVGMLKVMQDGEVNFYELMLLVEEEGSLALKVKHFTAGFVAWETKEDNVTFRLVSIEDDAIHFTGLSFYRLDDERMDGYIAMRTKDGVREERLQYRRVD